MNPTLLRRFGVQTCRKGGVWEESGWSSFNESPQWGGNVFDLKETVLMRNLLFSLSSFLLYHLDKISSDRPRMTDLLRSFQTIKTTVCRSLIHTFHSNNNNNNTTNKQDQRKSSRQAVIIQKQLLQCSISAHPLSIHQCWSSPWRPTQNRNKLLSFFSKTLKPEAQSTAKTFPYNLISLQALKAKVRLHRGGAGNPSPRAWGKQQRSRKEAILAFCMMLSVTRVTKSSFLREEKERGREVLTKAKSKESEDSLWGIFLLFFRHQ